MRRLILVRHGQTQWNREERFRGQIDVPLNETGLWQAEQAAKIIKRRFNVSAIFTSPLSRAMRTAEAIGREVGVPAQPSPLLTEFNFGEWEGKTPKEVETTYPEPYRLWLTELGRVEIPGGERMVDLRSRLTRALGEILAGHSEGDIVLVMHRMTNRMMASILLEGEDEMLSHLDFDTGSISVFEQSYGGWVVRSLNDTCHLGSGQSSEITG